jgi:crossover junction endodeoxyribonuclease RuvC
MVEMQPIARLLGLDISLNHTGWCFCETAHPGNLTYGVYDLEKSPLGEIEKMDFVLERLKPMFQPGLLVMIENFAFHAQGRSVLQLAGLQYLLRHHLFQSGIPFQLITPNQAKKFLTGKHHCDKNVILKEILKRYKLDVDDDNIADAINMNKIGQAVLGLLELDNQAQRDVIEELLKSPATKKGRNRGRKAVAETFMANHGELSRSR